MIISNTVVIQGWIGIVPVLHNLQPLYITESIISLIKTRKQVSFSLRNSEAITTIPIVISSLNSEDYSIGASSVVSTMQVIKYNIFGFTFLLTHYGTIFRYIN